MEVFNIIAGVASIVSLFLSIWNYQKVKEIESNISNNKIKQVADQNTMNGNSTIILNGITVNDNKNVKQ